MLDFILFHEKTVTLFREFLDSRGLKAVYSQQEEYYQISLPDDLDESLWDEVEARHAELMVMSQVIHYEENPEDRPMASVVVTLKDSRKVDAIVSPDVLMRVLDTISFEELDEMVAAIVHAVENPDDASFCDAVLDRRQEKLDREKEGRA